MNNCKYDMSKECVPEECTCDEDVTDVTDYTHLKVAIDFTTDDPSE